MRFKVCALFFYFFSNVDSPQLTVSFIDHLRSIFLFLISTMFNIIYILTILLDGAICPHSKSSSIYPRSLSLLKIHRGILFLCFFLFFKNSPRKRFRGWDSNRGPLERQANALTTMLCRSPQSMCLIVCACFWLMTGTSRTSIKQGPMYVTERWSEQDPCMPNFGSLFFVHW